MAVIRSRGHGKNRCTANSAATAADVAAVEDVCRNPEFRAFVRASLPDDLARSWPNPNVRAQRATKGRGAHVQPIASDHPGSLQPLKAICHGWRRQLDTPRELSDR